jgi:EAL domain-containing protein (putative c-di-GMP-specific phosphodiesterase class I)
VTALELAPVTYHRHELMRLTALRSYDILDTARDGDIDVLVRCAAKMLGTPVAALAMVDYDREWLKASYGWVREQEFPRAFAACSDVVAQDAPLVVVDLAEHPRYHRLSWVSGPSGMRSFVGVPVSGPDGLPLGALCALDSIPRRFGDEDVAVLTSLTASIVALLERRRVDAELTRRLAHTVSGTATSSVATPARIRAALDAGELEPYYQPIVTIADRRLVSMESLVRWNVPGIGLLTPAAFLPQVQRSPLLSQMVTEFMLRQVCHQVARWRRDGARDLTVSVNVTGSDVSSGTLFDLVADALHAAHLPPDALTIELTETVELYDRGVAISELGRLNHMGVRVSLDDFGVGYSGLEFVSLLPVNGVKIDRGFITQLGQSPTMRAALDNVVALTRSLNLELVAEGVENQAQADILLDAGVSCAQGFHFAQPAPAAQIGQLLAAAVGRLPVLPATH